VYEQALREGGTRGTSYPGPGTDLRIGQIGHGLGPRAFGDPRNELFYDDSMLTKNLQNCAEA